MTKILVAGDWHGNTRWAKKVVDEAKTLGCQVIVQCGDLGLWTHEYNGHLFLDELNAHLMSKDVKLVFVRGNHENHDHLRVFSQINPRSTNGHVYLRSHILYSEDGTRWAWDHKRFMTAGGAVSIDKAWRMAKEDKVRTLWWPGEQLTDADVWSIKATTEQRRRQGKPEVDYLFTHDCSDETPWQERIKPDADSQKHRQRIDQVLDIVRPQIHFHGHMHERYDWTNKTASGHWVQTYGLACDNMRDNFGVLDLETNTFQFETDLDPREF